MPKISIVIPVYKVENYLRKCLDSVLAQTMQDFELILVDDESPDSSGEICEEYAKKDARIRVIHQKNQGASAARNAGIAIAQGEWIGFVDSDDYIAADMYETLYQNAVKFDAGISVCRHAECYADRPVVLDKEIETKKLTAEEAVKLVLEAKILRVSPVDKLYRRELFDKIRYPQDMVIGEDAFIILELLRKAGTVAYTSAEKYFYVKREESLTTSAFREHDLDIVKAWKKNYKFICKYYPELEPEAGVRCCWAYFYVLDKMMRTPDFQRKDLQKQVIRELKKRKKYILKLPNFTRNRKIAFCLLMVHPLLYRMAVKKFFRQNRKLYGKEK